MEENYILNIGKSLSESSSKQALKCKYCSHELSSKLNLQSHIYIHAGEKPYICTELGCAESFSQGSLLSIHKKIHLDVKKSQLNTVSLFQKLSYPKLTDLLINHLDIHKTLYLNEISSFRLLLKEEDFAFAKPFFI
jgi:uncharacterized Zn-finger protein